MAMMAAKRAGLVSQRLAPIAYKGQAPEESSTYSSCNEQRRT